MTESRDYSTGNLHVLGLRGVVLRRPQMYFGDYAAAEWPLVIAAWTAHELLDYAVGPEPRVDVTLHQDGDLSAAVTGARVAWPAAAPSASVDELIRRRMWWHHLAQSTEVVVRRKGTPAGPADIVDDELVWSELDVVVRLSLDAGLIGVAPHRWWHDGTARLQAVFADRFRPAPGHLTVIDETAGTATQIC